MPRVKLFDETEVLTKAMELFWKQGYTATSIQELVSHLGINRASIYDTFGGKHELFERSFKLYRETNLAGTSTFFESQPNVKKGFEKLFDIAINEALTDESSKGCFVVNTTTELIPNDKKIVTVLESNKKDFENLFLSYLIKGKERGQLNPNLDLKSTASLLYMLYNGLRVVSKVNPKRSELKKSIRVGLSILN